MTHQPRQVLATLSLWLAAAPSALGSAASLATSPLLPGVAVTAAAMTTLTGCRVTDEDVHRWEKTEFGPNKLAAVVTHDKYAPALRIEAAASLIRMKPRNGKRVGIERLQESLRDLQPDERKKLVGGLIPIIIAEMDKPAPQQQGMAAEEKKAVDPSIPFKDAAFGLLIYDKAVLVTEDEHKTAIKEALLRWAVADFTTRIAISSQLYGLEQMFRFYKEEGVRVLPPLIKPDSAFDRIAALVADLGDAPTKLAAGQKLVELAKATEGSAFFNKMKPLIKEANLKGGADIDDKRLNLQVTSFQEEQVIKIFASIKKVAKQSRPAVDYLLQVAADKSRSVKIRQAALAALEGALDRQNSNDGTTVLAVASAEDTPDEVRDLAFQRITEQPRETVVKGLYGLFEQKDDKKWKIRWVAASTLLKMSTTKDIPEFLTKLPPALAPGFGMSEPIEYATQMGKMTPPVTREAMTTELKNPVLSIRLTALGYFYAYGKTGDIPLLAAVREDKALLPKVTDNDAKWQCQVPKAGGAKNETETKELASVGDFVKFCVEPNMATRK
jgi:hypothetical protein